jgi:hypothetical protein
MGAGVTLKYAMTTNRLFAAGYERLHEARRGFQT